MQMDFSQCAASVWPMLIVNWTCLAKQLRDKKLVNNVHYFSRDANQSLNYICDLFASRISYVNNIFASCAHCYWAAVRTRCVANVKNISSNLPVCQLFFAFVFFSHSMNVSLQINGKKTWIKYLSNNGKIQQRKYVMVAYEHLQISFLRLNSNRDARAQARTFARILYRRG